MTKITVPERTSSKRALEEIEELKAKRTKVQIDMEKTAQKLKTAGSFDHTFWHGRARYTSEEIEKARLTRQISRARFLARGEGDELAWENNATAKSLLDVEAALKIEQRLYNRQADKLMNEPEDEGKSDRRFFMRLYTTSRRGLDVQGDQTQPGPRDKKKQQKFRKALIEACGSTHPDPRSQDLWCPVLAVWVPQKAIHACHIFPKRAGQEDMDKIFGRKNPRRPEMDTIWNGMMMSQEAEGMIDDGHLLIVPNLPRNASEAQTSAWLASEPKSYKIKIVNPGFEDLHFYYPYQRKKTWVDLDGREVKFLTDHRPRARYFYWQYCVTMLRKSWETAPRDTGILKNELGRPYWGTRGPFLNERMLKAFVEEMGHEYDDLMEGAAPAGDDMRGDDVSDHTGLLVAAETLRATAERRNKAANEECSEKAGLKPL